jgi:hypothetical protein
MKENKRSEEKKLIVKVNFVTHPDKTKKENYYFFSVSLNSSCIYFVIQKKLNYNKKDVVKMNKEKKKLRQQEKH